MPSHAATQLVLYVQALAVTRPLLKMDRSDSGASLQSDSDATLPMPGESADKVDAAAADAAAADDDEAAAADDDDDDEDDESDRAPTSRY